MPFTIPKTVEDLPAYENYAMAGRTYRYMTKEPLVPFGFGLSYSSVVFSQPSIEITDNEAIIRVQLTNTGSFNIEEVAQLYLSSPLAGEGQPLFSLKSFSRVSIGNNESKTISFKLDKESYNFV